VVCIRKKYLRLLEVTFDILALRVVAQLSLGSGNIPSQDFVILYKG
jgi:hypothetical protein